MKVLLFIMKPIVLLLAFAALIYFRSIIFHANVNQYINTALSYAEEKFDISIPSHFAVDAQSAVTSQNECESIALNVVKKEPGIEPVSVANESNQDIVTDKNTGDADAIMDVLSDAASSINKKIDVLFDTDRSSSVIDPVSNADEGVNVLASVDQGADDLAGRGRANAAVSATDSLSVDAKQLLFKARRLFWSGNVQDSEKSYLDLINVDNSDPDVYGELGNVYYAQGKWKQAGEAYYEAAIRLLEQNKNEQIVQRVSYLLRVIQGLDVVSAEKLRNKISS